MWLLTQPTISNLHRGWRSSLRDHSQYCRHPRETNAKQNRDVLQQGNQQLTVNDRDFSATTG